MRRALLISALVLSGAAGCGHGQRVRDVAALRQAPLYTFNEREVDAYLKWLADRPLGTRRRVVRLGRQNVGQPYRLFLLGEFPFELYDPDPMYCLAAGDCVTFVEQTYAMALARDWPSFFRTLQRIRYKDGQVGLLTRNHFTEADWNVHNAWLFADVTEIVAEGRARPMRTTIDRTAFFAKFGIDRKFPVQHFESRYIPREDLPDVLPRLQDADVIEIVRGNKRSQYVSHVGLIMHDDSGGVTLLHSTIPAVREEPLLGYIQRHQNILGIKILRLNRSVKLPDG